MKYPLIIFVSDMSDNKKQPTPVRLWPSGSPEGRAEAAADAAAERRREAARRAEEERRRFQEWRQEERARQAREDAARKESYNPYKKK